jgi:prepilin-type N-terminal cleavage/methylation domain-containing protein
MKRPGNRRTGLGFTLTEVLIVIGIIAVLAGLLSGVLVRAKGMAHETVEISNLRQLGAAASLYAEEYGSMPLGCTILAEWNAAYKPLCSSPVDPTKVGIANELIAFHARSSNVYENLGVPYRHSYIGFRDLAWTKDRFEKLVVPFPNPGWLVSLSISEPRRDSPTYSENSSGHYFRLMLDGSVQRKTHVNANGLIDGIQTQFRTPAMLFVDVDKEWMQSYGK